MVYLINLELMVMKMVKKSSLVQLKYRLRIDNEKKIL